MAFSLAPLPFDYNALEPHIDETTMRIHHGKHHQAYVTNLNAALEGQGALQSRSIEALLADLGGRSGTTAGATSITPSFGAGWFRAAPGPPKARSPGTSRAPSGGSMPSRN